MSSFKNIGHFLSLHYSKIIKPHLFKSEGVGVGFFVLIHIILLYSDLNQVGTVSK